MLYFCSNPQQYLNQFVGDGECVAFVRKCTGAPQAKFWKQSTTQVKGNGSSIKTGTAIATFKGGTYANQSSGNHAAIYIRQDATHLYVYDQWGKRPTRKAKAVSERAIKFGNLGASPSDDGAAFWVIE